MFSLWGNSGLLGKFFKLRNDDDLWSKIPPLFPVASKIAAKTIGLDLVSVIPEKGGETGPGLFNIVDASEDKYKEQPGDVGHTFGYGFYIVNEKGEHVHISIDEKEYLRLAKKYKKEEDET